MKTNTLHPSRLIKRIASDDVIDEVYEWLCKAREDYHFNNDVWDLRFYWHEIKPALQENLIAGARRFEPVRRIWTPDGYLHIWTSLDAFVLKSMAIAMGEELRPNLSPHCYHLTGRGGQKGVVRADHGNLDDARFLFRSDIASYYASINHDILLNQVKALIHDDLTLQLVEGSLPKASRG